MTCQRLKTGIFAGSFNPIHIGHLALANYLCEFEGIDEVWFLVTPHNPLKSPGELIDDQVRFKMVQTAIDHYPRFKASDFEFHLPRPNYTIDTLHALQTAYPERTFYFIMGADNWESIHKWKDYPVLLQNYSILIYPRKGYKADIPCEYPNIRIVNAPYMEISSTFIRQAIRNGKDIRFFLPPGIYNMCLQAFSIKK